MIKLAPPLKIPISGPLPNFAHSDLTKRPLSLTMWGYIYLSFKYISFSQ